MEFGEYGMIATFLAGLIGLVVLFGQLKMFSIDKNLREIRKLLESKKD